MNFDTLFVDKQGQIDIGVVDAFLDSQDKPYCPNECEHAGCKFRHVTTAFVERKPMAIYVEKCSHAVEKFALRIAKSRLIQQGVEGLVL